MPGQQREGFADAGQHAESEHIDLQHPHGVEIVFVPLDHGTVFHRRILDRHQRVETCRGDHETTDMLAQMAR